MSSLRATDRQHLTRAVDLSPEAPWRRSPSDVVPGATVDGPDEELAERVRELHRRHRGSPTSTPAGARTAR